jgi:hypothetical protein
LIFYLRFADARTSVRSVRAQERRGAGAGEEDAQGPQPLTAGGHRFYNCINANICARLCDN